MCLCDVSDSHAFIIVSSGNKQAYAVVRFLGRIQLMVLNQVGGKFFSTVNHIDCNLSPREEVEVVGNVLI